MSDSELDPGKEWSTGEPITFMKPQGDESESDGWVVWHICDMTYVLLCEDGAITTDPTMCKVFDTHEEANELVNKVRESWPKADDFGIGVSGLTDRQGFLSAGETW